MRRGINSTHISNVYMFHYSAPQEDEPLVAENESPEDPGSGQEDAKSIDFDEVFRLYDLLTSACSMFLSKFSILNINTAA